MPGQQRQEPALLALLGRIVRVLAVSLHDGKVLAEAPTGQPALEMTGVDG